MKTLLQNYFTKKQNLFYLLIIILLVLILTFIIIIGNKNIVQSADDYPILLHKAVTVEYGQKLDLKPNKLIKNYNKLNKKEIFINQNIPNEANKTYPALGKYEIKITYKKSITIQKINVIDSTAPTLIVPENITILQGTNLNDFDFKSQLQSSDLSQLNDFIIDYSKINSAVTGSYPLYVSISDISGNTSSKQTTVIVKRKVQNESVPNTQKRNNQQNSINKRNSQKSNNNSHISNSNLNINKETDSSQNSNSSSDSSQSSDNNSSSDNTESRSDEIE